MAPAAGQTADEPNEGSQAEWDSVNTTLHLKWYGRQGRTYFIQQSTDDLGAFTYLKTVETGDDAVREWGFTTNSERTNMPTKYFVRLKWTDIPTTNGALADFDGDGLGNLADLEANADPFVADSDGDGLSDGVEASIGTKANNPDSNTNGMTDGEELLNGGDPRVPGPAPTPIAPVSPDPPVPADPPPTPPDALAPADHDILVKSESISFPKYGFDTFQPQNPPRRYLYRFERDFHTPSSAAPDFPYGPVELTSTIEPTTGQQSDDGSDPETGPDMDCTAPIAETIAPLFWTVKASASSGDFWDSGYFAFLRNENTTEMMVSNGKSQLSAPTQMRALANTDAGFEAGAPLAFRNVHENQLTFDYQKTQFKLKWKDGVSEEQRHAVTYLLVFEPENNPATPENESVVNAEIIQTISWDGQTAESGPFAIDPDEKKPGIDGRYFLLPIEFEIIHTEADPSTGNPVNPGKAKVFRDEIVDLRMKIPPLGGYDWSVDLTIEPEAMRTQNLPGRGDVQMYDFGQIEPDGTVMPDKTQFVLKPSDGGERTIRAVFNKAGKLNVRIKSTDGKIDFASPEYTVEERIRKYAVPYVGYGSHDPNQYDQEFVDAAKLWGDFYGCQIDTVDRLKAMAVPESDVGANPDRPNDILTVGHPGDNVLATIRGNPVKWDYDKDAKQACDETYKKLNYAAAGIGSTREAIKWGALWLYHKAMTRKNNPAWTWEKRNVSPLDVLDENEEPEYTIGDWDSWTTATQEYNAKWPNYASERVGKALLSGLHYNAGANDNIWPIRSNRSARP